MNLVEKINADIKSAMLAREKEKLEALRAVKSALLLAGSEKGANGEVSEEAGLSVLQKLVKQRKEAAEIYIKQNRKDLAEPEVFQAGIIEKYLPRQLSEAEVKGVVAKLISKMGATSPADMGKVIGAAMGQLQGQADGKLVSTVVRQLLA